MEFYILFGLLIGGAIVLLYRSRRSTTDWRESPNAGLPDDQRDKFAYPWTRTPTRCGSGSPANSPFRGNRATARTAAEPQMIATRDAGRGG